MNAYKKVQKIRDSRKSIFHHIHARTVSTSFENIRNRRKNNTMALKRIDTKVGDLQKILSNPNYFFDKELSFLLVDIKNRVINTRKNTKKPLNLYLERENTSAVAKIIRDYQGLQSLVNGILSKLKKGENQ